ncbi:MAG: hypothetical protein E6Q40_15645 [Cupriavidus sp.]|nr:MAG: hypothetical protein E6Q40_15645 [Cupriavidus sp.]
MTHIRILRSPGVTSYDVAGGAEPPWGVGFELAHFELELRNHGDLGADAAYLQRVRSFDAIWDRNVAGCSFTEAPGAKFVMATGELGLIKAQEIASGAYVWCWGVAAEKDSIQRAMRALMRQHLREKINSLEQAVSVLDGMEDPCGVR